MALSLVAGVVAVSPTWSDITTSDTVILNSVVLYGDGSSVAAGLGLGFTQQGDGGLGFVSGCYLVWR